MTIEEAIKVIFKMLSYTDLRARENLHADMVDACRMAIDTMRKYQKIEEIYQKWNEVNDFSYNQAMRNIGEVLEDGKID